MMNGSTYSASSFDRNRDKINVQRFLRRLEAQVQAEQDATSGEHKGSDPDALDSNDSGYGTDSYSYYGSLATLTVRPDGRIALDCGTDLDPINAGYQAGPAYAQDQQRGR